MEGRDGSRRASSLLRVLVGRADDVRRRAGPGLTAACSDGYAISKLAARHATHGWMILLASPKANDDAEDRGIFESIRRSFRFTR